MKKKLLISVSLILIAILSGIFLNFNIDIGKSDSDNQRALTLGFKDSLTITIGMAGQAYAASPDYTCDGTADNIEFQTALNALPANGGKLTVLGGQYNFASTVTRAIGNVIVEGVGYSSYLVLNGAVPLFTAGGSNWVFQDIRFDAGFVTTNTDTQVLRCWDGATYYAAYTESGADNWNVPTGRGATVTVAASNSSDDSKAQADYVCDGTADNVEIQEAIDFVTVAGGGGVYLFEGDYVIASTLTIGSNIHFYGNSRFDPVITLAASTNTDMISLSGGGWVLENFKLDGNKSNQGAGSHDGIYSNNSTNGLMRNIRIESCKAKGVYLAGASGWQIDLYNVSAYYNDDDGFEIANEKCNLYSCFAVTNGDKGFIASDNDIGFYGCNAETNIGMGVQFNNYQKCKFIDGIVWNNGGGGMQLSGSDWCTIRNTNSGSNTGIGIWVYSSATAQANNNEISSCVINNNSSHGIQMSKNVAGTAPDGTIISKNVFTGNGGSAVNNTASSDNHWSKNEGFITVNSGSSTGTGGQQTIAHGLNVTPVRSDITLTMIGQGTYAAYAIAVPSPTWFYIKAPVGVAYAWRVDTED